MLTLLRHWVIHRVNKACNLMCVNYYDDEIYKRRNNYAKIMDYVIEWIMQNLNKTYYLADSKSSCYSHTRIKIFQRFFAQFNNALLTYNLLPCMKIKSSLFFHRWRLGYQLHFLSEWFLKQASSPDFCVLFLCCLAKNRSPPWSPPMNTP